MSTTPERSGPTRRKRVAVIGAGPSGCVTIKELKEAGHEVVAFELQPGIGGTFADALPELELTTSDSNTSFGSRPAGRSRDPAIWSAHEYVTYLEDFAKHFQLLPHIQFSTRVESVRYEAEKWRIETQPVAQPTSSGERDRYGADGTLRISPVRAEVAVDHVVICSGTNRRPTLPGWAQTGRFHGLILHSSQLAGAHEFEGKRVLIVGLGESGSDIALMASKRAKAVAISSRSGPGFVIPRYYRGRPSDLDTNRCYHSIPRSLTGSRIVRFKTRIEELFLSEADDRKVLGHAKQLNARRGRSPFHRFGTKSAAFIEALLYHGASYRPDVARVELDRVVFDDGSEFPCDMIVCCTGYAPHLPFLEKYEPGLAARASLPRRLYKRMFDPSLGTGIAWIGFVRPGVGSVPPCAEMQARFLALVLSGACSLPSEAQMQREIELQAALDCEQFPDDAERIATLTDYLRFMDDLAEQIGCRPPIRRLLLRDPLTALKLLFAPLTGAQYRLVGPGATPAAARRSIRQLPTMPWPVLAYELALLVGSHLTGATQERWRTRVSPSPPHTEGSGSKV